MAKKNHGRQFAKERHEKLIGTRHNSLRIEAVEHGKTPGGTPAWYFLCKCDCGKPHRVASHNLKHARSCGCHRLAAANPKRETPREKHSKLIGRRFGRLVVRAYDGALLCDCDCGKKNHRVATWNIATTKSCGCYRSDSVPKRRGQRGVEPGDRSHRLKVLQLVHKRTPSGKSVRMVECRCDCGKTTTTRVDNFLHGTVKSCGCLRKELAAERAAGRSHGLHGSPNYHLWQAVKDRTSNPDHSHYARLDVPMHGPWQRDYKRFVAYIEKHLGPKPTPRHSLDRIDVNKGYVPGNLRWASPAEQSRNRRNNHWITVDGETLCLTDWAERLRTSPSTIQNRLKLGWTEEQAVTSPVRRRSS